MALAEWEKIANKGRRTAALRMLMMEPRATYWGARSETSLADIRDLEIGVHGWAKEWPLGCVNPAS